MIAFKVIIDFNESIYDCIYFMIAVMGLSMCSVNFQYSTSIVQLSFCCRVA